MTIVHYPAFLLIVMVCVALVVGVYPSALFTGMFEENPRAPSTGVRYSSYKTRMRQGTIDR